MGSAVLQPISRRQILKFKTWGTVWTCRPVETIGTQGIEAAHNINQIPSTIAPTVFASIWVIEITPQRKSSDLVVKSQRVIANTAGARLCELIMNARNETLL